MPDWTKSMQRTFEYYTVDPGTWKDVKKLENVKFSSISRDSTVETLGSATIDVTESVGECYVRIYLITIQNGITEKFPLGTFLVQTPSSSFDGKVRNVTMDAYTPLLELKEKQPPIGYSILEGENIMSITERICRENARAPVIGADCAEILADDFVANTDETWLSFLIDLAANAKYNFELDEMGRILFAPKQNTASLQPRWTYDDGNSSIVQSNFTLDHDIYGIPNVVEVVYSQGKDYFHSRKVNNDENSPVSTVNRGREIPYRVVNPSFVGMATQKQVDEYAERLLRELSTVEYTVRYTHGYCPVRVNDCVRLNFPRFGLSGIKARVISQNIKCDASCQVSEVVKFTTKLWG